MTARQQIHVYRGGHGQLSGDYDLLDVKEAGCLLSVWTKMQSHGNK